MKSGGFVWGKITSRQISALKQTIEQYNKKEKRN
jgi:hypothetical protein